MKSKPFQYLVFFSGITLLILFFSSGCYSQPDLNTTVNVAIIADGQTHTLSVLPGISVEDAINQAGITLSSLDRITPSLTSEISPNMRIQIFRVTEKFESEQVIVPFETQTIKNETLAEGETLRIQAGNNGKIQNTYRILYEDGIEYSRILYKQEIINEALPEILMIGIQSNFSDISIPGRIIYLASGNVWMMKKSSSQRSLLVSTGDLDGRIFSLSQDGKWLLFSRSQDDNDNSVINELWFINTEAKNPVPVNLSIDNIIHFADWQPNSELTIAYSTVEPRETAPGWQANNDLILASFNSDGQILEQKTILETNSGGVFGWWGYQYAWSPDGSLIAYSRPDSVGIIDIHSGEAKQLVEITPYQTQSNWAWTPSLSWSPNNKKLFFSTHGLSNSTDETDPYFSISSASISDTEATESIAENTGMFSYPANSPQLEDKYSLAYLQAIDTDKSDTSTYNLFIIDPKDGNQQKVFPKEGTIGLAPQTVQWSPTQTTDGEAYIGFIFQGNIWLENLSTLKTHQLTGDESVKLMIWK